MDKIFSLGIELFEEIAMFLGVSYQLLKNILFWIVFPSITIWLFVQYRKYKKELYSLRKKIENELFENNSNSVYKPKF